MPSAKRLPSPDAFMLLAMALLLAPTLWTRDPNPDSLTYLADGLRLLAGAVIYRDFFEFTAPGAPLLAAGIFAVTGPSLLAARCVQAVGLLIAGWYTARLTRLLGVGPWLSTLPSLILIAGLFRFQPHFSYHWLVVPGVAAGLYYTALTLRDGEALSPRKGEDWTFQDENRYASWLAGLATGITCLFLQSDGLVLAIALFGAIVADFVVGEWDFKRLMARLGRFFGGMALALAPVVFWLAGHSAIPDAYQYLWVWALSQYAQPGGMNDIRFATDLTQYVSPFTNWINLPYLYAKIYTVLVLYGVLLGTVAGTLAWATGIVWRLLSEGETWHPAERPWAVVGLAALGFGLLATRGRADIVHVAIYALPAIILATGAAAAFARTFDEPEALFVRHMPTGVLLGFVATGLLIAGLEARQHRDFWWPPANPDTVYRNAPIVQYLRDRAQPGDRLVSLPNGGYLYLYALPPAVPITQFYAGAYLTPAQVKDYWATVTRTRPRFIVFVPYNDPAKTRKEYFPFGLPQGYKLVKTFDKPLDDQVQPWLSEIYERDDAGMDDPPIFPVTDFKNKTKR